MRRHPRWGGVLWACVLAVALLAAAAPASAAPPSNDNRADAAAVPDFPAALAGTTVEATLERLDPQVSQCGRVESSVWYSINPSPDGTIAASAQGAGLAPVLRVYRATGSGISEVDCASAAVGQTAQVAFAGVRGASFLVLVGKRPGTTDGAFTIDTQLFLPPANDAKKSAQALRSLPATVKGSTLGATSDATDPGSCSIDSGTVWYTVAPGNAARFVVKLRAVGDLDAAMVVQQKIRSETENVACVKTDGKGNAAAAVDVSKGATYTVVVGARAGSPAGDFVLEALAAQAAEKAPGRQLAAAGVTSAVNGLTDVNDMWWTELVPGTAYRIAFSSKGCASVRVQSMRNPESALGGLRCRGYVTFTPGPDGGGRYTFEVVAPRSTATAAYRLQVAPALADDVGVGLELANLAHVSGTLSPSGIDVVDLYHFDVARTSDVRLRLAQRAGRAFGLVLMSDDGRRLSSGGLTLDRRLATGRYVVAVAGLTGTPGGRYNLSLVVRQLTSTSISIGAGEVRPGAPVTIRALTTPPTGGGTIDIQIDRFDPLTGWHFFRMVHLSAPSASLSWTPPALGRWRARASFAGTLGFSPSRSEYVPLLVATPIG